MAKSNAPTEDLKTGKTIISPSKSGYKASDPLSTKHKDTDGASKG